MGIGLVVNCVAVPPATLHSAGIGDPPLVELMLNAFMLIVMAGFGVPAIIPIKLPPVTVVVEGLVFPTFVITICCDAGTFVALKDRLGQFIAPVTVYPVIEPICIVDAPSGPRLLVLSLTCMPADHVPAG